MLDIAFQSKVKMMPIAQTFMKAFHCFNFCYFVVQPTFTMTIGKQPVFTTSPCYVITSHLYLFFFFLLTRS